MRATPGVNQNNKKNKSGEKNLIKDEHIRKIERIFQKEYN